MSSIFQEFSELAFGSVWNLFTKQLSDLQNEIFDSEDFKNLLEIMQFISHAKSASFQNYQEENIMQQNKSKKDSAIPSPMSVRFAFPDWDEENKEEKSLESLELPIVNPEKKAYTSIKGRKPTPYPKSNSSIMTHLQQFPIPITEVIHPINVNQDNISLNNKILDCQKSIRKFKGEFDEPSILNEKEKVNCQINKAFPGIQINAESTIHPMESNSDTNKNIIISNYSKDFQINENGNPCNESSLNFAEGQNSKELYVINERGSFANHIPTLEDQQKDNNLNESNNLKTVVLSEQNINCPNNHNLISNEEIKKFQQDSSEYELTFPYRTNPSLTYEINNDHEFDESNFKVIEKYEETKDSNTGKIENRLVKRLLTFKEKILPVWASDFKNLYNYLNFQMKIDPKSIFGNLYATEIKNLKKSVFPNSRIKRGTSEFAKNSEETFNNNCREEIFTFNDIGIQNLEKNQIGKGDLNKINENVPTS